MKLDELALGATYNDQVLISPEMVESFARATGDRNPIHFNAEAAKRADFPGIVAHGDLVVALANGMIVEHVPGITLVERRAEFVRPVLVGSIVTIEATLTDRSERKRGSRTIHELHFDVRYLSGAGKLCVRASIKALFVIDQERR